MIKELVKKECELCKKEFEINIRSKSKRILNKRFCSGTCAKKFNGINNRGKKRTEEYKKELSERSKGEGNPFYGKKHTTESKSLIGNANQWSEEDYVYVNFTQEQKEIFDGIMISDGHLSSSRISARITLGFKYKETIERIINDLDCLNFSEIYKYDFISKINGNILPNYFTKSNFNATLLSEYNRWYHDGVKVIPKDIILTPLFCYWWFVMDGYINKKSIRLCTECFNNEDLLFIVECFNEINLFPKLKDRKITHEVRKRLTFNTKETIKFFYYIKDIKIQKGI